MAKKDDTPDTKPVDQTGEAVPQHKRLAQGKPPPVTGPRTPH